MTRAEDTPDDVLTFWNSRAGLGQWAGSRDVIAKQLEITAISSHVRDGMRVLDVGCGNGITAIELARRFAVQVTGLDFAEEMIAAAKALAQGQDLRGSIAFQVGDVRELPELREVFNLVYTERALINLPDWETQRAAIVCIMRTLVSGGVYLMCENSQDGLDRINELRARVELPNIDPPWHNRYLRDSEIAQLQIPGVTLEAVDHFSSTYYVLSRVINAALARQSGHEPDYESPINQLALRLPAIGKCGQGRVWVWRKN